MVLIDIEMPEGCESCPLARKSDIVPDATLCIAVGKSMKGIGRPPYCPLIPDVFDGETPKKKRGECPERDACMTEFGTRLDSHGTLVVKAKNLESVKRVFVLEEGSIYGSLFYRDGL